MSTSDSPFPIRERGERFLFSKGMDMTDDEFREQLRLLMSHKDFENPEFLEQMRSVYQERWRDPQFREAMTRLITERWQDVTFRETMSQKAKGRWRDAEFREVMERIMHDPRHREQMRQASKENWQDTEYRDKVSHGIQGTKPRNNTSGYVGVSWVKRNHRWRAYISHHGTRYELGSYARKEEVAAAYNKKALEFYGNRAKLNHIGEIDL